MSQPEQANHQVRSTPTQYIPRTQSSPKERDARWSESALSNMVNHRLHHRLGDLAPRLKKALDTPIQPLDVMSLCRQFEF
jgi:hypothetical protein